MGFFSKPQKQEQHEPDEKPIRRAKIVGVRPSYFNPHALTGATHVDCVFFDVIFDYEDGTRNIFTFMGKDALRPYLQYLDID